MSTNPYYPAFLDLRGRRILVVGGGMVALRKVESLLAAGATVIVVAPDPIATMDDIAREQRLVELHARAYEPDDMAGVCLVIAATDDEDTNRQVSADAAARQLFCNVVDVTPLCSFIVPAVVDKGPIRVAISTGGVSPALARNLRGVIGRHIGDEYATLADIMGRIRPLVLAQEGGHSAHKRVFDILVDSQLLEAIRDGDRALVAETLTQALGSEIDLEDIL